MSLICIFGNSHLGALAQSKDGLERLQADGHEVFFWGIAGSNFNNLKLDGHTVISPAPFQSARISAGRFEHLDLRIPDVVVFCGFSFGPSFQARHIAMTAQKLTQVSSGLRDAVIDAEIERLFQESTANKLITPIARQFPEKTFMFVPQPLVAKHEEFLDRISDIEAYGDTQERVLRYYGQQMTHCGVDFIPQPAQTISDRYFTKPEYSKGSARLVSAEAHEDADIKHMNADYGALILELIAEKL